MDENHAKYHETWNRLLMSNKNSEIEKLKEYVENEVRRINFVNNSKVSKKDLVDLEESIFVAIDDLKEDYKYINNKIDKTIFPDKGRSKQVKLGLIILIGGVICWIVKTL